MREKYIPYSDCAVLVKFGDSIDAETGARVAEFTAEVRAAEIRGVLELIPAYSSLTVVFDPLLTDGKSIVRSLKAARRHGRGHIDFRPVQYELPVCYEGEFAPDLSSVAQLAGISTKEVIELHTQPSYRIYMLGFLPGFAYLGGLSSRIAVPRLESPRIKIPRGSVGIGGSQTGIYPLDSPGGWRLIGRTPAEVYTPESERPILYRAGDRIRFYPVSISEYKEIRSSVAAGTYTVKSTEVRYGN